MNLNWNENVVVFDIETDGLIDEATKVHCVSVGRVTKSGKIKVMSITDYDEMIDFFSDESLTLVGHNIIRYDNVVIKKLLGVKIPIDRVIDTLPLSWVLNTKNLEHGLEYWGDFYGVPKPAISDWKNLSVEQYCTRCEEDVKINVHLWEDLKEYLYTLYNRDEGAIKRFISYSNFKSDCVRVQEEVGVRFDLEACEAAMEKLNGEIKPKIDTLSSLMPKVEVYSKKTVPKVRTKADGTFSSNWLKWLEFKAQYGVPDEYDNETHVEYVSGYKDASAGSSQQLKDWLFSLDWKPETFKPTVRKGGIQAEVPQIYTEDKRVCPSIEKLYSKVPELALLDSLGRLKHRLSLLKGFIEEARQDESGNLRLYGSISGYTNTMRLTHKKPLVNLPKVTLPYGEEIRGCLIPDDGMVFNGADLSGIESVTRNHYLMPYDPEYVKELDNPLYDPHIDIGVLAGFFSKEDGDLYINIDKGIIKDPTPEQKAIVKSMKPLRSKSKTTNFSATYGVGAKKLSKTADITEAEARKLLDIYWQRNWAIRAFANDCKTKQVNGQMWIQNPVSGFFYSLRSEKDRFSTVNSSTAVFVFDVWIKHLRAHGFVIQYQCHDEVLFSIPEGTEDENRGLMSEIMKSVNEELKMNVTVSMSPAYGHSYAAVH